MYVKQEKEVTTTKVTMADVGDLNDIVYGNNGKRKPYTFSADLVSLKYVGTAIHVYNEDGTVAGVMAYYPAADTKCKLLEKGAK